MKKLSLMLIALCASFVINAQTATNVTVQLENHTNCGYYVSARHIQSSSPCVSLGQVTVFVPAAGPLGPGTATLPAVAGAHYEAASVMDNPPSPSYAVEIQAPDATTPGWPGATIQCFANGTFPVCKDAIGCSGLPTEACWDGTPASPVIVIVN